MTRVGDQYSCGCWAREVPKCHHMHDAASEPHRSSERCVSHNVSSIMTCELPLDVIMIIAGVGRESVGVEIANGKQFMTSSFLNGEQVSEPSRLHGIVHLRITSTTLSDDNAKATGVATCVGHLTHPI